VQELTGLAANHRYTITEPSGASPPLVSPLEFLKRQPAGQFIEIGQRVGLSLSAPELELDEFEYQPLLPLRLNRLGPGIAFGDVDEDGKDDFVFGGPTGTATQLFLAFGGGQYLPEIAFGFDRPVDTADAAPLIFDANGDGKNDLLLTKGGVAMPAGHAAYQPTLLLTRGRARWTTAPDDMLPELLISAWPAVSADFDRDGSLDIFIGVRVVPAAYPTAPCAAVK
jgi:hypothetical protein